MPRSLRYKGKNAVDTAVWRFGDVTIAWAMNGLRAVSVGVAGFAGIGALAAAISGAIGWRLARRIESGEPQVGSGDATGLIALAPQCDWRA